MDLKIGMVFESLEGEILSVSEPKMVPTKYGRKIKVASSKFKSASTGEIELTLWADNATAFRSGDKVKLIKAEVHEFRGVKSLSVAPPSKGGNIVRV